MSRPLGAVLLALTLAACGSGGTSGEKPALRRAVQNYSDAYLTGDANTAYALLSKRCQARTTEADFAALVSQAKGLYGTALPMKTFKVDLNDAQARVTYTYEMAAINQTDEPWVKESGDWHQDDC